MANWFVRSLATGTGAGTSWTNATTTIAAAITLSAAGDTFLVADDHAETAGAAKTLSFKGTSGSPDTIVCVDHTIASPGSGDLKTGATVTTTGAFAITITGYIYCRGIAFSAASGAVSNGMSLGPSTNVQTYELCSFAVPGTGTPQILISSAAHAIVRWINCTVSFGGTGANISPANGAWEWYNTASAITGATIPTNLVAGTINASRILFEGVDLSAAGSGKSLFAITSFPTQAVIKDCKLGSSVSVTSGSPGQIEYNIAVIRCDSANTNYRSEVYNWLGTLTTETTIVRTGGATDGTTAFSHKIVTVAQTSYGKPFTSLPIAIWNDTTGSAKTITVEGIASAVPNNDVVWMDVEYLGDSSSPRGSISSTAKLPLATAAANTTSTSTWGGALTGKFKMAATITPQQKGPITVYIRVAGSTTTVYIDPYITVT